MSRVVKGIKRGFKSIGSRVEGALKGDIGDIVSVGTFGMSDLATKPIETVGQKVSEAFLPEMPDVNIPDPAAASPGQVARGQADVDIGTTEGSRRRSGAAKGSRKLRVPLGGLR